MVKLWFHSSIASSEAYKSESGMNTSCYKYKRNTIGVILEWILTTRTSATTPRISIFTLSLLKIRAFCWTVPNVCFPMSRRWKKLSNCFHLFHHCKLHSRENLEMKYERNQMKLGYLKIVANEKCTSEIGKLSSVKNLFWVNHASAKAPNSPKRKTFGWTNVPEKMNWINSVILENWVRNGQNTLKIA